MSEDLFDKQGRGLYLTPEEREAFLDAARNAPRPVRTFSHTLPTTGCRHAYGIKVISENPHTKRRVGNLLPTRLVCQAARYGFGVRFG